jgi:hypothetical protein
LDATLEIGTRGAVTASVTKVIQSLVGEYAAANALPVVAEDLQPVNTSLQDIRRTFVEKLFAIHAAYHKNRAANQTRHYYDLYKLCELEEIKTYTGTAQYRRCFEEVKALSKEHFEKQAVPEGNSVSSSAAFGPTGEDLSVLDRNYRNESHLFFVTPPALVEILEGIHTLLPKL